MDQGEPGNVVSRQEQLSLVQDAMTRTLQFLTCYLPLANAHNTDFIVKDQIRNLIPQQIADELFQLDLAHLALLPSGKCWEDGDRDTAIKEDFHDANSLTGTTECKREVALDEVNRKSQKNEKIGLTSENENSTASEPESQLEWNHSTLKDFVVAAKRHTLPNLGVLASRGDVLTHIDAKEEDSIFIEKFMTSKKCHEVDIMSKICSKLATHVGTDKVIDIGSGRGYLSSQLSLMYSLQVLGIDSSSVNTESAQQRTQKLEKHWNGLVRIAEGKPSKKELKKKEKKSRLKGEKATNVVDLNLSAGEDFFDVESLLFGLPDNDEDASKKECEDHDSAVNSERDLIETDLDNSNPISTQSSSAKADSGGKVLSETDLGEAKIGQLKTCSTGLLGSSPDRMKYSSERKSGGEFPLSDTITTHSSSANADRPSRKKSQQKSKQKSANVQKEKAAPSFIPLTLYVDTNTDLNALACRHFHLEDGESHLSRQLLTGLHTCGDLASSMLRIFCVNDSIKALCNVGCCYHLIEEEFRRNPYLPPDAPGPSSYGFPMSEFLRNRECGLGRNARMLAAQALARIEEERKLPSSSLFWRALLQVILRDLTGTVSDEWKVGKVAAKCKSFKDYVYKSFKKLGIHTDQLSDEKIAEYLERYADQERAMQVFFQLRTVLAPCIEGLLLMDRLCFLLEQDCVQQTWLVQLFDPVTSPRCYGIIALK